MMPNPIRLFFGFLIALMLLPGYSMATHLRAGEITVRRDACNNLRFWITITVFTNTLGTTVLFGGDDDILDFGDGSDPDHDGKVGFLVPETPNTIRSDLGTGIATASFTIEHIYAGASSYTISYSEPNRNEGVVNMDGSVNTRFYIETRIMIDPLLGCNENTPVLAVPPIDRGCVGVAWFHNPGAYDLDGDSLSYELVVPFRERKTTVVNYRQPNDIRFYGTNFGTGNEAGSDEPTFGINAFDGTITWDAPGSKGEYNIAFIIKEWRFVEDRWVEIGFVRRDMQILIEECDNERPELIVPDDICVEAGTTLNAQIFGMDPDQDSVKIEAFSEIFFLPNAQSPASFSPDPPVFQSSVPQAVLNFEWKTECIHVKDQPYQVVFKISDRANPSLVTFETWLIRVVGPRPTFPDDDSQAISTNLENRTVKLTWESYFCQNAEIMQIWRRVDSLQFEPDTCQTGMPENLGYELIDQVPVGSDTTYIDDNGGKGLNAGAAYCYRLVAIFPAPEGGESPVSKEVCIPPILADEPIITNVSVLGTGEDNGVIEIKWVPPFEADVTQFPPPYTYHLYRADAFQGTANLQLVDEVIDATSYVDNGLNTQAKPYNYRIIAFSSNGNPMDTSAVASSVRLNAQSRLNEIALNWRADVPWSNELPGYRHKIYRGDEGATTINDMVLIDSVEVIGDGFIYSDTGRYNNTPLVGGQFYCYIVETFGSYGNDNPILADRDPLRNLSQVVCTQPGDTIPPCQLEVPFIVGDPKTCDQIRAEDPCGKNQFSNTFLWNAPPTECAVDISHYRIYRKRPENTEFFFLADVFEETTYTDTDLDSYAACYKVSAVDRSGNEGLQSEQICFDNCPQYVLPNVFTPNGDQCNDIFRAYSDKTDYLIPAEGGEAESFICMSKEQADQLNLKCARFVESVDFKVFNRWGKRVYAYNSKAIAEGTIYLDWDGRASDGSQLTTGIYYYQADVVYTVMDPAARYETKKGWVHIVH